MAQQFHTKGVHPKEMKTDVHTKTVYGCSFIHDLPKQETTQMSIKSVSE